MRPRIRYARKRLDAGLGDVVRAVGACLTTGLTARRTAAQQDDRAATAVAAQWEPADAVLPCLSARSGLDLLFSCVDWPAGSEVVLSAVTIPHVVRLVREHGYVPVPVDLDPTTMDVSADAVEAACTTRTRAVLITHLFGATADTTAVAELTGRRGLLLIEDRAQSYDGTSRALGRADVAVHSFGTIKTATCFGGGLILVADRSLLARMRDRQQGFPVQPTSAYLRRVVTAGVLIVVSRPRWYPALTRALDRFGGDFDAVIRSVSRGFGDTDLLRQLRHRPCPALLATMSTRLGRYDPARIERRRIAGQALLEALGPGVRPLGGRAPRPTHWLVAVSAADPAGLVAAGRRAGFDLTTGSSTLTAVDPGCRRATRAMDTVVYVPCDPSTPAPAVGVLAQVISTYGNGPAEPPQRPRRRPPAPVAQDRQRRVAGRASSRGVPMG